MRSPLWTSAVTLAALVSITACGAVADDPTTPKAPAAAAEDKPTQKADMWHAGDDPELFGIELEYRVDELPNSGAAINVPWAGNYWPTYQDSINYRWAGEESESPAAKYGQVFGLEDFEDRVSGQYGIEKYADRTECEDDEACDDTIGEVCAKRAGEDVGRCIPTWWGICHAWAPAAILEAEPVHPVTIDGVTFSVNDIKALITLLYDRADAKLLSSRCYADATSEDGVDTDEYGNPTGQDAGCKDTNPGTLHVLVTNLLGVRGESFIEDRTYDDEVWNQPLVEYKLLEMEPIEPRAANELLGVTTITEGTDTTHSLAGTVAEAVWFDGGTYPVPAGGQVTVELSGTGNPDLYVRLGEEPTATAFDCRSSEPEADESCTVEGAHAETTVSVGILGTAASEGFTISVTITDPAAEIPEAYLFNDEAASLRRVEMALTFVAESPAALDGNLADVASFFHYTDVYDYVLELDADGAIIGGEYIGDSKENHPDFLWMPLGRRVVPIAGGALSYAVVRMLLDRSVSGEDGGLVPTLEHETGSLAQSEWHTYGPFEVAAGDLDVAIAGTGDADLYVREGSAPTPWQFDCRPYLNGSDEVCRLSGAGTYYVAVRGYLAAEYELFAGYAAAAPEEPTEPEEPASSHLNVSGTVALNEMAVFSIDIEAATPITIQTLSEQDVDLYLKLGQAPTTVAYDLKAYTWSGNESMTVSASVPGTLYIGVHGYQAASFTLVTSDP